MYTQVTILGGIELENSAETFKVLQVPFRLMFVVLLWGSIEGHLWYIHVPYPPFILHCEYVVQTVQSAAMKRYDNVRQNKWTDIARIKSHTFNLL